MLLTALLLPLSGFAAADRSGYDGFVEARKRIPYTTLRYKIKKD